MFKSNLPVAIKAGAVSVILLVVSVGCVKRASESATPTATPSVASPVASENGHPRLFFDASHVPTLQAKAATTHSDIWMSIKEYASAELGTQPPASAPHAGVTRHRNHGNMLIPLAFACVITEETDYCNLAKTYLLTYATWEQWGESGFRDLGLAHMLLGNAIAYDWLYDLLTPAEQKSVRQALAGWAQKMYEASVGPKDDSWRNWWRKSYMQNHYAINHSALGVAGLALLGEDNRAETWVDHATSSISLTRDILNRIEDGSWHEGIHYQDYALTMLLPFLVNIREIQGIDILPHMYLRNYSYWRIYNHIPNSTQNILAYGDFEPEWGSAYRPRNVLRFVASEYGDGHAEWMARQLIAAGGRSANIWSTPWYVFEFLYYDPTVDPEPPVAFENVRVFSDLEGVIWRTGWDDNDLIFGLKTGAYGGRFAFDTFTHEVPPWEPPCIDIGCELNIGHDHDDTNTFYIHRAGQWLAPEIEGAGKSDTAWHNTILIDGQGQRRPDDYDDPEDFLGSDGFLEATASAPDFDYVAADATRLYPHILGIEDVTRHVVFVRPDYFMIVDNLAADADHEYEWVAHFEQSVSVEGKWVRGDASDGQILGVEVVEPESFEATMGDDGRPYVHIKSSPVADVRFVHILYPTDQAGWATKPTGTTTEDTGEAISVRVQMNDRGARTDDILLTYVQPAPASAVGTYYYDGQAAIVTRGADDRLERLFMYGGTFLSDQAMDKLLVINLDRDEPFEATYMDNTVAVHGQLLTEVRLYAPQAEHLTINGMPWSFARSGDYITFE